MLTGWALTLEQKSVTINLNQRKKNMKNILVAAALVAVSSLAANANELGGGFSWNLETTAEHNVDTEVSTWTITPELNYDMMGLLNLEVSSKLNLYDGTDWAWDETTHLTEPTINFEASKEVVANAEIYAKTGYDFKTDDMTDVTVGVNWSW